MKINVKFYRESKGFTQHELAQLSKISQSYLNEVENNLKIPKLKVLERIADALGVCINLLIIPDSTNSHCKSCKRNKL